MSAEEIFNDRKNKFLRIGRNKGFISNLEDLSSLEVNKKLSLQIFKSKKLLLFISFVVIAIISLITLL